MPNATDPSVSTAVAQCLVVDDDPQVRDALVRVVQSQGLACLSADSGDAALAVLAEHGEALVRNFLS